MKETDVEKFKQLSNVDTPHPEKCRTVEVFESNGHVSLSLGESYMKDKIGNGVTRQKWK